MWAILLQSRAFAVLSSVQLTWLSRSLGCAIFTIVRRGFGEMCALIRCACEDSVPCLAVDSLQTGECFVWNRGCKVLCMRGAIELVGVRRIVCEFRHSTTVSPPLSCVECPDSSGCWLFLLWVRASHEAAAAAYDPQLNPQLWVVQKNGGLPPSPRRFSRNGTIPHERLHWFPITRHA